MSKWLSVGRESALKGNNDDHCTLAFLIRWSDFLSDICSEGDGGEST